MDTHEETAPATEREPTLLGAMTELHDREQADRECWYVLHRTLLTVGLNVVARALRDDGLGPSELFSTTELDLLSYAADLEYDLTGDCEWCGPLLENLFPERASDALEEDRASSLRGRDHMAKVLQDWHGMSSRTHCLPFRRQEDSTNG